ncbi:MAG: peptidoglycan-binding protein [Coriobacteriia bacterium]|nr:peptidoglycan-binding protein [Coriobacteriia bacterium]
MDTFALNDSGAAVEDIQQRLVLVGCLPQDGVSGVFDAETAAAVRAFCKQASLPETDQVDNKVWAALVDASFSMGDRTLYLRMPYLHGHDVRELQQVLSALGFGCGGVDGIFGAHTEDALRRFQVNMGLPDDGIAGAYTFAAIRRLHHSWEDKDLVPDAKELGFARAADVLESNALCLYGTQPFTRSVAARMSNLALATNPSSKITSADSLLMAPDEDMLRVHVVLPEERTGKVPRVTYQPEESLALRLRTACHAARNATNKQVAVQLPGQVWEDAGEGRSAQHFAITLLDALCSALQ